MSKFWLWGQRTYDDYLRLTWPDELINMFNSFDAAKLEAQRRYGLPEKDTDWINYAVILEVNHNIPVQEWRTPDQPIIDGLLPTLEFSIFRWWQTPLPKP